MNKKSLQESHAAKKKGVEQSKRKVKMLFSVLRSSPDFLFFVLLMEAINEKLEKKNPGYKINKQKKRKERKWRKNSFKFPFLVVALFFF
jgi:hypothetical protein